jgi:hypothetical protein
MWPFKRRKHAGEASDHGSWSVAQGQYNGAPLFVRIRQGARAVFAGGAYMHRVGIAVPLREPDRNGLPQGAEFNDLARIEDILASALEREGKSVHVLSITTNGMREYVFYTSDPDGVSGAFLTLQAQVRSHQLQLSIEPDPMWEVYGQFTSEHDA